MLCANRAAIAAQCHESLTESSSSNTNPFSSFHAILQNDLKNPHFYPIPPKVALGSSIRLGCDAICTSAARQTPKRERVAPALRELPVGVTIPHSSTVIRASRQWTLSRWAIAPHTNWISLATPPHDRSDNLSPRARYVARRIDAEKFRRVIRARLVPRERSLHAATPCTIRDVTVRCSLVADQPRVSALCEAPRGWAVLSNLGRH